MKTILLADDSITIQKVVELTFSEGDYQVICVSNGTEALKKIRDLRPNVALLDIIMPEKNGYEVCQEMKSDPSTADIPVLLLTGTFEPFDEKRADAVGAHGHLTKPFESHALVTRVDELIAAGGGASGPRSPAMDPQSPPAMAAPSPYSEEIPSAPAPLGMPPDADNGGSLQASAPFDLGSADEEFVPDRFDDQELPAGATVRLSRDELFAAGQEQEGVADAAPMEEPSPAVPMDGFVSGYEIPQTGAAAAPRGNSVGVRSDSALPVLTQEMVDRIAERVVQRMSDRAVREIAWEVIPQVAEAIVRNRIKELEEQGEG